MQVIENLKVKEKLYIDKLDNGLTVMLIPKKNMSKKYAIIGTHFGSLDNHFIAPGSQEDITIPDGVAHFLEHKMFEQKDGTNSLDTLSALGVDANAYTTDDHTAYLFACTDHFEEAFDELMDYVQNPYFTNENVEKEKGIIGQEITMYDDDPATVVYMNALKALYKDNPVRIDIAGTIESISKINPEILNKCYDTFYNPSNMAIAICGDFEPESMMAGITKRLIEKPKQGEIKRIYPERETKINKAKIEKEMEVSNPIFVIGYLDKEQYTDEIVKRHIAIEILLSILIGKSSDLYKKLYENGDILSEPELSYEFSKQYAHVLISGQSKNPEKVYEELKKQVEKYKKEGFSQEEFERIKKKIYGAYVVEYNDVSTIAKMFLSDFFKGINSFDYLEEYNLVTIEYMKQVFEEIFTTDNMVLSIVKGKEKRRTNKVCLFYVRGHYATGSISII